jgi:hypothetical protein
VKKKKQTPKPAKETKPRLQRNPGKTSGFFLHVYSFEKTSKQQVVDEYLMGRKLGRNSGEKLKKKDCENRRAKRGDGVVEQRGGGRGRRTRLPITAREEEDQFFAMIMN